MSVRRRRWAEAPRLAPLTGAAIGAVGGAVYWAGAQIWPSSVAVVLSMLATSLLASSLLDARPAAQGGLRSGGAGPAAFVFAVLIKYNLLMALSAAKLAFALPANLALGLIMIAGHACSRALAVTVPPSPSHLASTPPSHADLVIALLLGFAPAVLMGLPGLIGLAAAIAARIAFAAHLRRHRPANFPAMREMARLLTESCFYLGALAAWAYV